jgi:prophage regulatory protein
MQVVNSEASPRPAPERLLREPERRARTGVSTSAWYEMMRNGTAPQPVRLGPRTVAWRESAIEKWIATRPSRDAVAA